MHRELTSFFHIEAYSAFLFLAFLCGHMWARRRARTTAVEPRHIDNLTLLIILFSLVGARLFSWMFYQKPGTPFFENLKLWGGGGLVFYGGMLFGLGCVVVYSLLIRISFGKLADIYAPSLALGLGFGRIGCFMAGCCWGDICSPAALAGLDPVVIHQVTTVPALSPAGFPLAVTFPPDTGAFQQHSRLGLITENASRSLPVHPAQLYEAVLAFLLCFYLHRSFRRGHFRGEIFARFGIGYALIRFLVEFLRADNPPQYVGLTLSQVISLIVGLGAAAYYFVQKRMSADLAMREVAVLPDAVDV